MELGDFCVFINNDLYIVEGIFLNKYFIEYFFIKLDSFFLNVIFLEIFIRKMEILEMGDEYSD